VSTNPNSLPSQTKIIWAALTLSQLLYLVVGIIAVSPSESKVPDDIILIALLVAGLSAIAVACLVIPMIVKVQSLEEVLTPFIIQWALVESMAVIGLVGRFLGASDTFFFGSIFLSVMFMLILFPTKKRAMRFVHQKSTRQESE
jgi:hypothetical protein